MSAAEESSSTTAFDEGYRVPRVICGASAIDPLVPYQSPSVFGGFPETLALADITSAATDRHQMGWGEPFLKTLALADITSAATDRHQMGWGGPFLKTLALAGLGITSTVTDLGIGLAPRHPVKIQAYRTRIEELCAAAEQDGYLLSSVSGDDFWSFVLSEPQLRRGNLVLMENGNLRLVWKEDGKEMHLGLQFLGKGMVQYVIFKRRKAMCPISRAAGRDTFEGLKRQIDSFELHSLLYE